MLLGVCVHALLKAEHLANHLSPPSHHHRDTDGVRRSTSIMNEWRLFCSRLHSSTLCYKIVTTTIIADDSCGNNYDSC